MSDRVVDCDVHSALPSRDALFPYLDEHWRKYMLETHFRLPVAIDNAYPPWSEMLATPAGPPQLGRASLGILNCYLAVEAFSHPYLASALATAANRWLAAEWLDADERLLGTASIAPQHTTQAIDEVRRVARDRHFVQIVVPARSDEPYGSERFWPLWEAAAEAGLAVAMGAAGTATHPPTTVGHLPTLCETYANTTPFQAQILGLVVSGIFQRLPSLRFVMLESGWTWLPMLMWKLDQEWKAFRREVPWLDEPPSTYVRRHFRFTIAPTDAPPSDDDLRAVLAQLGSDELLLYASDFPHCYDDGAERLLSLLDDEQARRVLWGNAAACYGLDERLGALAS